MLVALALLAIAPVGDEAAVFLGEYRNRGMSEAGARQFFAQNVARCALVERHQRQVRDEYARFERVRDAKPFQLADYDRARRSLDALHHRLQAERTEAEMRQLRALPAADRGAAASFSNWSPRCPALDPPRAPPPPRP